MHCYVRCGAIQVMSTEELVFEGCNFFRQRLAYSVLSGRPTTIKNIRKDDDAPGIRGRLATVGVIFVISTASLNLRFLQILKQS